MQATFAQLRSSFRTLLKIPFYLTEFVSRFFFFLIWLFRFTSICAVVGLNIMHHSLSFSMDLEDKELN